MKKLVARSQGELARAKAVLSEGAAILATSKTEKLLTSELIQAISHRSSTNMLYR